MADATDSKSVGGNPMRVRLSPRALRVPVVSLQSLLLLTYGLSWALLAPWLYLYKVTFAGSPPTWLWMLAPLAYIGGSSPSVAAIILAARSRDPQALRTLVSPVLAWRVPARWFAVALLVPPLATAASVMIADHGVGPFRHFNLGAVLIAAPGIYALAVPFGPLGEELGWRGVALPHLLTRLHAWQASLILAVLWTLWHVPQMLLLPGASIPSFMPLSATSVALYFVQMSGITALITLVFLRTNGSLLLAILTHLAFNTAENVVYAGLPALAVDQQRSVYLVNVWVLAAIGWVSLIWLTRRQTNPPGAGVIPDR
jgi:membrane protease YdiL (CAAX protease family)